MSVQKASGSFTPELKAKWVAALRSGEYQQCRGKLSDGNSYCCLGVLAVVSGVPKEHLKDYEMLSAVNRELATSLEGARDPYERSKQFALERLNDGLRDTGEGAQPFSVIADYIEANL